MKELYSANVRVTGGRDGGARSDDGRFEARMALPEALGGSGQGTNPEQLFAAGFAGCFASSIQFVTRNRKLDTGDVSIDATVTLGLREDGSYGLKAALDVTVAGPDGGDLADAIVEAKRICAYSNATRGNVETSYRVNGRVV